MQQAENTKHRGRGAPQKQIAKETFRLCVSLNREEHERITAAAAQGGIGMAAYVRSMVFQGRLIARLTEEEKVLFREMIGVSRDLSRLIKMAEEQGLSGMQILLEPYFESVDKLLNKIKL
jgi:Mobilization protein NikA